MDHAKRLRRLRWAMEKAGCEALLVTHLPDVRYLCGFTGSNAVLAITARRAALFTDGRYKTQAREQSVGVRVSIGKQALAEACRLLQRLGPSAISYDADHVTVAELGRMQAALDGGLGAVARQHAFAPADPYLLPALRELKDEEELAHVEAAALLGCRLFDQVAPRLEAGTPEREVAAELEFLARSLGADSMSFETIVASGQRSSLPHGAATDRPLPRKGFVTLDFGVILRGYCSDMTRTVYMGRPSREESAAYDAVLEAQESAVAAVRAGVLAGEIDKAASRSIVSPRPVSRASCQSGTLSSLG